MSPKKPQLLRLAVALYSFELCVLLAWLAFYKKADTALHVFLVSRPGIVLLLALVGLIVATGFIVSAYYRDRDDPAHRFRLVVLLNLFTVIVAGGLGETLIRVVSTPPQGQWRKAYLVPDPLVGWTVGRSRVSANRLYVSSTEGIRSGTPDFSFADVDSKYRIALVGDSYSFSQDVNYESSWGYDLQQKLGQDFLVLNFGVNGYGLDQAYLRYRRDVVPWKPNVVVLGLIQHDLRRLLTVYSFISFPSWQFPFAKPRFIFRDGELSLLNTPLPTPEQLFSLPAITDLLHLHYEKAYHDWEWQEQWYHGSHGLRFLTSRFQRWPKKGPAFSAQTIEALSRAILQAFRALAQRHGSTSLLVYFPSIGAGDFSDSAPPANRESHGLGKRLVADAGMPHVDLTACLRSVDATKRFVPGKPHYASPGNEAIASCLVERVREAAVGKGRR
jgi:hypothetical protein